MTRGITHTHGIICFLPLWHVVRGEIVYIDSEQPKDIKLITLNESVTPTKLFQYLTLPCNNIPAMWPWSYWVSHSHQSLQLCLVVATILLLVYFNFFISAPVLLIENYHIYQKKITMMLYNYGLYEVNTCFMDQKSNIV